MGSVPWQERPCGLRLRARCPGMGKRPRGGQENRTWSLSRAPGHRAKAAFLAGGRSVLWGQQEGIWGENAPWADRAGRTWSPGG